MAAWSAAAEGDRFLLGDGLRTGKSGTAQLSLGADGMALVEPNTVLRFLDRDPRAGSGNRLSLETGVVRIDSGRLMLDVHTARALARVPEGASVRIISAAGDTRFDVLVGRVAIDADGATKELAAGQTLAVPNAPPSSAASDDLRRRRRHGASRDSAGRRRVDAARTSRRGRHARASTTPST